MLSPADPPSPLTPAPAGHVYGNDEPPLPPVVLAEDDPTTVNMLRSMLTAEGYPVLVVEDGNAALRQLVSSPGTIVISDWMMPGMDGIELCRRIRGCEDIRFVYFIMLTSHASVTHRIKAFEQGVDDFITKPVAPEELMARLHAARRIIRLEQNLDRQNRQAQYLNAELAMLNDQLNHTASYDKLTGVFSRGCGEQALRRRWDQAIRGNQNLACMMVDIDRFKAINDTYGHGMGDQALRWVAQLLKHHTRPGDLVFRFGGDEFVVICPETDLEAAHELGDRLRRKVLDLAGHPAGPPIPLSLCVGVANRNLDMVSPHDLVELADHRLYTAKAAR